MSKEATKAAPDGTKVVLEGYAVKGDAEKVSEALTRLYKRDSVLTPEAVLEAARAKTSPLHGCFLWDNDVAAEQFRLQQARQLIRSVRVIYADSTPKRVWVHVVNPSESDQEKRKGYAPVRVVVASPTRRELAFNALRDRARSTVKAMHEFAAEWVESAEKPREVQAAEGLLQELDEVLERLASMVARPG